MDMLSSLFNLGLGILASAFLWNAVHPEHFAWLKRRGEVKKPVVISDRTERIILIVFIIVMFGLALFGLHTLLSR